MAWKLRVAGCLPGSRAGTAAAITRRELAGAFDRRFGPRGDDGARDASRELFLAQPVQRIRELALRGAREPLGRGLTGLVVHPHVERPVLHETEAAIGFVELRR